MESWYDPNLWKKEIEAERKETERKASEEDEPLIGWKGSFYIFWSIWELLSLGGWGRESKDTPSPRPGMDPSLLRDDGSVIVKKETVLEMRKITKKECREVAVLTLADTYPILNRTQLEKLYDEIMKIQGT